MNEADFWETTLHSFHLRLKGWREARETERQERWEQTRVIAYNAVVPHLKSTDRDFQRFMPFSWENAGTPEMAAPPELTEAEEARRRYDQKRAMNLHFRKETEELIRQHYQPDWGPHPDEL